MFVQNNCAFQKDLHYYDFSSVLSGVLEAYV